MSEMFDQIKAGWEEHDRLELERRRTGWYAAIAALIADQPSAEDVRHLVQSLGWIDSEEMLRTIRELSIRAIEEQRPAELAFLRLVATVVEREIGLPAPASTDGDVGEVLGARFTAQAFPVMLERADELAPAGRYTEALRVLDELARDIDALPSEQRELMERSELVRIRLRAELGRAEALFALDRVDEALAAYEAVVQRAADAGGTGIGWFDEPGFRLMGVRGIARVQLRRGHANSAAETSREIIRATVAADGQPQPADLNNLGKALLAASHARLALEQFRRARAAAQAGRPSPHAHFGEADALGLLGDT